ncbi:MAG: hypothetical protein V3W18_05155 [candidate division Zixibacteria bacterium]
MRKHDTGSGFTLVELILIIVIIGIIASVALKSMLPAAEKVRVEATIHEMEILSGAIIGNPELITDGIRTDFGYVGDVGALPVDLDALVANPGGYSTWKGPYIQNSFVENTDDYKKDSWGDIYTYSGGVSIFSNGGGSPLTRQFAGDIPELTANTVNGNIYDGLGMAPGDSSIGVSVTIIIPDGAGSMTSIATTPGSDGFFTFAGVIPIGNHLIKGIYSATNDTTARYLSVVPGSTVYCQLRFSGSLW